MSNFTTDGCVLNMYADDVIIYTSAATSDDLQLKLQRCVDNIYVVFQEYVNDQQKEICCNGYR